MNQIDIFYEASTRGTNDAINKIREKMICELGNGVIPRDIIESNIRWRILSSELDHVINTLKPSETYTRRVFNHKGGRMSHHDIELIFYNGEDMVKVCKLEFKYGASEINDCPQWASPMKPSQYFDISYEDMFYAEYLPRLCDKYGEEVPVKEIYMKEIHNNNPPCMTDFKIKYDKGNKNSRNKTPLYTGEQCDIDNYNFAKQLNNESIKKFLETSTLDVDRLNEYFRGTQKDKIYLLWNEGEFNIRTRSVEDYQINSEPLTIKNNNTLVGKTMTGNIIQILFRWKNGVAYPALQIS